MIDSPTKTTRRGRELIPQREIQVLSHKEEERALDGQPRQCPRRKLGASREAPLACQLTGLLNTFEGLLALMCERHSFVPLAFTFLKIPVGRPPYVCTTCNSVGPLGLQTLSGVTRVDQCASTRGPGREAGLLRDPVPSRCLLCRGRPRRMEGLAVTLSCPRCFPFSWSLSCSAGGLQTWSAPSARLGLHPRCFSLYPESMEKTRSHVSVSRFSGTFSIWKRKD